MTELPTEAIETPRLHLEPLRIEDAVEMTAVLSDPRLYTFIGGRPPTSSELTDQYSRQVAGRSSDGTEQWLNWVIRQADTRTATGYVQASVVRGPETDVPGARAANVAWVVGSEHQGRGYAVEAATAMVGWLRSHGVAQVVADVHPDHHASTAVARRLGMAPTGEIVDGEVRWAVEV